VERTRVTGRRCSSRAGGGVGEQQRGAQAGRGKPHATAAQEQAGGAQRQPRRPQGAALR